MNRTKQLILVLLLAISSVSVFAGSVDESQSGGKDPVLIASFSVKEETQCMATASRDIDANLAITNVSNANILIKRGGGENITVLGLFGTRTLRPLLSAWMSMSDQGPGARPADIVVRPGNTYAYTLKVRLDSEILSQPGFYKIRISYRAYRELPAETESIAQSYLGGETNGAIIEVRSCDSH